jgi:Flp pilus assembly protein TadG
MTPTAAATHLQRQPQRRWQVSDRGSASLELVIIFPVLLLIIFGAMQGALYYFACSAALASAQEGARAAADERASTGDGQSAASAFLTSAGGTNTLQHPHISVSRSATTATVTVAGRSLSLLPGWAGIPVEQTASAAVERVT